MKPWAARHRFRLLVGAVASALVWAVWPGVFTGLAAAEQDHTPAAQEAETKDASGDADPKDPAPGDESTEAEADTEESRADESVEVFVPSEEISEDIDVPFPVDI